METGSRFPFARASARADELPVYQPRLIYCQGATLSARFAIDNLPTAMLAC